MTIWIHFRQLQLYCALQWNRGVYVQANSNIISTHLSEESKDKTRTKQTLRSTPNLVPNLMFRTAYGAWLMLSEPPHKTTSDSRRQISYSHTKKALDELIYYVNDQILTWEPLMMDWKPDPQSLFTVRAGTGMGMPHLRPTWRAMYAASAELWYYGHWEKKKEK